MIMHHRCLCDYLYRAFAYLVALITRLINLLLDDLNDHFTQLIKKCIFMYKSNTCQYHIISHVLVGSL